MKKILSILMLLVAIATGASADIVWQSDMQETIEGVTQTKSRSNDSWATNLSKAWASGYAKAFQYTGSGTLTLAFSEALDLQEGDIIRCYAGAENNTARTLSLYVNNGSDPVKTVSLPYGTLRVLDYEVTSNLSLSSLKIGSNNNATFLFKVLIFRNKPTTGSTMISYGFTRSSMAVQGYTDNFISTISNFSENITLSNLTTDTNNGQASLSGNITGQQTTESDTYYADLQFKVADGYIFSPSAVSFKWIGNSTSLKAKVAIMDATTTVTSNESTVSNTSISLANATSITFANDAFTGKSFSGTVHIRVYMYGVTGKRAYLATPFTITGTVASAAPATPYTVTFNAGDYGTCATTSLKEAEAGAGVTLPEVTPNSGYVFNGWYTAATEGTKVGDAGNNYKPSADNTPLYAQYSEIPTPTFVLSETSIEVGQTAQIKVTGKDDLDGVTLSDISYGTADIVTVDATTGVVTPVAAGSTTITFNSSAVAGKYNASSGNLSITVTAPKCATPTISPVSFSTDNQEVTITSATDGATIYYTTDGTDPTVSSNEYNPESKPTISSTTTFKAIAVKENYDDSDVATQKVTRTSSAVVANWNFTNWSSETQAGVRTDNTNWRDYEDSTDKKPLNDKVYSNKVANATFVYSETTIPETKGLSFATTAYTFGLAFDQASTTIGTYHGSEYLWLYGSNSTITIPSLTAGQTIEIGFESHKTSEERTLTITNINESNPKATEYKVQTVTVKNDGNVTITPSKGMHIYYIKVTSNVETVPVSTVGSNNYATYVTESNLDFTGVEGITAYIATGDNGSTITTEAVTKVPAGTALLIKTAEPGATVNVPVAASTPATLTANKLKFLTSPLLISSIDETVKRYYGFFKVGKKYGFAPMKEGILAAKKAYLDYGSGNSLEFIALDLEDAPTAINFVEAENNANSAAPIKVIKNGKLYIGNYNVAGQQVK